LLVPLTLGWIMPWRSTKLQSIITTNTRFGDRNLRFDAKAGPLYGPFAVAWIGGIATYLGLFGFLGAIFFQRILESRQTGLPFIPSATEVGLVIAAFIVAGVLFALVNAWYRARTINHFANHTHFENASFSGRLTALGLIWLSITNFLIMIAGALLLGVVLTLGAIPFVDVANLSAGVQSRTGLLILQLIPIAVFVGFTLFGPIIQARSAGYLVRNLSLDGTAPIDEIAQAAGADVRFGEGLAEAFDVDAI